MFQFVLPVMMAAAASAQSYMYPAYNAHMTRYTYPMSSYYPTFGQMAPAQYIRSGSYYYPYSKTHFAMTYPTFMARSENMPSTYDAIKPVDAKLHHHNQHVASQVVGAHMPTTMGHVSQVAGVPHMPHTQQLVAGVPTTAYGYGMSPIPVTAGLNKEMIPTVPADSQLSHPVVNHGHQQFVAQPGMSYAAGVPMTTDAHVASTGYPVAFPAYNYASHIPGRIEPAAIGMTGGASFVPAQAYSVDVKSVGPSAVSTHGSTISHDVKHPTFEGKKGSF